MVYRKGELSNRQLNEKWPHQVALAQLEAPGAQFARHDLITEFCRGRSTAPRGHSVVHEGLWWNVHCFAEPADAEEFRERFGGLPFDPRDKGTGHNWTRWSPGKARERDIKKSRGK